MHPYKRSVRVSDLIREEVADIVMNKIKHKTFGFITITGAKMTSDLRNATVYFSVLNEDEQMKTLRKLNESKSFIKRELGSRLRMKFIPTIKFELDQGVEYGKKIDKLLGEINIERSPIDDDEDLF